MYKAVKSISNQFYPSVCLSVYQHIYQVKWLLYGAITWHSKTYVYLKETKVYTEDWAKSTGWAMFRGWVLFHKITVYIYMAVINDIQLCSQEY